jgi:hypothetical protein
MNRNRRHLTGCAVVLSMMILSFPSLNYPQGKDQGKDQEIVTSVMLKITTPKGHWATAPLVEGKMITIVDKTTGVGYGFVPVVRSIEERSVELTMFQVIEKASEINVLKAVESTEIKVGAQQQISSIPFEVKVLAITQDLKDQDVPSKSVSSPSPQLPLCCVDCFEERICATCGVRTDCGCCCVGGRCCGGC